jgi:uncharacterized lipoprotein YmbA
MAWTSIIAMIVFTGCFGKSPKVEFYKLIEDLQGLEDDQIEVMDQTIAIGVGPMEFPKTIDRPQIVTRISPHRLEVDEFHRWAGSLRDDFLEVLTVNLSILLRSNHVAAYPWEEFFNPDYRIFMDVHEFVGDLGGTVILAVTWTITDAEGRKAVLARKSIIREPVLGTDFEAYVSAINRSLSTFSQEIAREIEKLGS